MSAITTHVLDMSSGRPASGVPVVLESRSAGNEWKTLGRGKTDADGRLANLLPAGAQLEPGTYRLIFGAAAYFGARNAESFYPEVAVVFTIRDTTEHYHVALLLSPYGYTTYRGS
ncbi:MAG TPA: hydroxyisourate hydrolase [Candidatus Acidoferrales bacterium]|jgi:5-hydroxyisourate hydrolase|nr:hydroxyisourate hydrolase [Candidatus Acidoferrales bacterium]